jgi:hypothetical protein
MKGDIPEKQLFLAVWLYLHEPRAYCFGSHLIASSNVTEQSVFL